MPLRPQFREALTLLATAAERMVEKNLSAPILVGGAAVELYTGGTIVSGDFDFVSSWQHEFFSELKALGFERPARAGWLQRSLLHPRLDLAVQVVSGAVMDGKSDPARVKVIEVDGHELRVIPVEDVIADRMSQALAGSGIEKTMQNQAVRLYQLAETID